MPVQQLAGVGRQKLSNWMMSVSHNVTRLHLEDRQEQLVHLSLAPPKAVKAEALQQLQVGATEKEAVLCIVYPGLHAHTASGHKIHRRRWGWTAFMESRDLPRQSTIEPKLYSPFAWQFARCTLAPTPAEP